MYPEQSTGLNISIYFYFINEEKTLQLHWKYVDLQTIPIYEKIVYELMLTTICSYFSTVMRVIENQIIRLL